MSPRTSGLARQLPDVVRDLNHLTSEPGGLPVPDAYTVIAELNTLAYRLGQLLDQLGANLTSRHQQGGLRLDAVGLDHYATTDTAVGMGRAALAEAADAARVLAQALDQAQSVTATIADTGPTRQRS